jgi:alkylhydroperoxidase/carboxymuconolactone decarboxylase family protein YurZ
MNSEIPALEFEQLPPSIAELLRSKYERLGYLGEFFARTAHQEDALKAFIEFTNASKGALDTRQVELIALTVACIKNVAYEKNQHERLAVRLGFTRDWVLEVELLQPELATLLNESEKQVQLFVIEALRNEGMGSDKALQAIVKNMGVENAVAVMMVMARYVAHGLMVNCLGITAPVPSIFEDGFDGETSTEAQQCPGQ